MRVYIKASIFALALLAAGVLVSPSAQYQIQRGLDTVYNITVRNVAKFADGTAAAPSITFASDTDSGWSRPGSNIIDESVGGVAKRRISPTIMSLSSDMSLAWHSTVNEGGGADDLFLTRDAANILAQRNGTNAQVFRIYNTDNGSNDEYLTIGWDSNNAYFAADKSGSGTQRTINFNGATINYQIGGSTKWSVSADGELTTSSDDLALANRGTASFTNGGAVNVTVTLPVVQANTSYYVALGPNKPVAAYVNSKSTVEFVLTIPSSTTMNVDWMIVR